MKKTVNLFYLLPPKHQESLKFWYRISWILLAAALIIVLSINACQLMHIMYAKTKRDELIVAQRNNPFCESLEALQTQKNNFQRSLEKIGRYQSATKVPLELLNYISSVIPKDTALTQIAYQDKTSLTVSGQTHNLRSLEQFLESLKKSNHYKTIKLDSLHHGRDTKDENSLIDFRLIAALI
ncbi:PilN domain-containing protein [Candidatus Dependentiae bacterium]|nr:PilN domain-containing protein [Candidatus Dependentiae bacterium]